ncbi:MAG TPA: type IV toxin-antitoxin system AbiEi family antitoxin domain-containing protein [Solirubrobacteraceae bacterium]
MPVAGPRNRIAPITEDQWGLITRRQALDAGISKTTLDRLTTEGGDLRRIGHGVYQLAGAPEPDHLDLRAAWLQLAPTIPAWKRDPRSGVVSHRSAAEMYGIGDLPADRHNFTVDRRRQTRQPNIRLHTRSLGDHDWILLRGLPVTLPSRVASDLLHDRDDPEAVANVIADGIRRVFDYPSSFTKALRPHAYRFGLRRGDGLGLLRWLLELVGDPQTSVWLLEAQMEDQPSAPPRPSPEATP